MLQQTVLKTKSVSTPFENGSYVTAAWNMDLAEEDGFSAPGLSHHVFYEGSQLSLFFAIVRSSEIKDSKFSSPGSGALKE